MTTDVLMREMLRDIAKECRITGGYTGRYTLQQRVFDALTAVPREEFVPEELKPYAYDNTPLPIGHGQTISQPFIVGLMTDLLEAQPDDVVLEIGGGSGYQAAVLAKLVRKVYSLEIIPSLAREASSRLHRLGIHNVEVLVADGSEGLPRYAPYDGIIVTAAAPRVPTTLVSQLKPFGRMVIPVGRQHRPQELVLVEKSDREVVSQPVLAVSFVPFTGKEGVSGPVTVPEVD